MVSDRKRDVVDMLKHFNIKIDNPLVFMEQTTMKQFIQGDEKTKYDVLMQALNFRSLEQNFTVTEDNLLNMNETLKRYKDVELGKKREERDKAQDELRAVEHLRTRQEQIVEMEKRVAWAEVQEYETEIEGIEGEIHQLETTMEVLNRDIATDQEKLKELEMSSEQFQQQLNGIMNDMSLQMEESEKVEKEMQAVIGPRDDADVKIREKTRQRAQLLRQAEASRAQVQKLSKEILALANNTGKRQEMDRLRSLMATSEEEQRKGQESIAGLEEEETRLAGIQEDVENRLRDATMAASRADEAVREDRKREQELVNARVNANSRYGTQMVELIDRMKRTRFAKPVFGPIGTYLHVKEEYKEWIPALEIFLDRLLSSVIVSQGSRDASLMRKLIRESGVARCNVIEVNYDGELVMDRRLMVDASFLTFLDIVEFDNPVVKKAVIMQSSLERRILCKTRRDVETITGKGPSQQMPANCHSFVLRNGDTIRIVKGRPSYTSNAKRASGLLQPSVDVVLQQTQASLREDQATLQEAQRVVSGVKQERNNLLAQLNQLRSALRSQKSRLSSLAREANANQRKLDELIAEDDESELLGLRDQQQTAEEAIARIEGEVRSVDGELVALKAERDAQEALMGPLTARRETLRQRLADTQMKVRRVRERMDVETERLKLETHAQKSRDGLTHLEEEKKAKESVLRQKQAVVAQSVAALGEENRVKEKLSKRTCEAELQKFKADLTSELEQLGVKDLDVLNRAFEEKQKAYKRSVEEYEKVKEEGLEMERLDKRQRLSYNQLRNEAQQQICLRFTQFLSQRKAEGIVNIDHQTKEVSLKVKMDSYYEAAASQVTNIRVLSGGEKSFVTLSLIMATAHIIESPFFIMDEFDVFMDEANRHVSLMTIIQTAREEKKQFIFITPHNLETVVKEMGRGGEESDIRIVTLADHQRERTS